MGKLLNFEDRFNFKCFSFFIFMEFSLVKMIFVYKFKEFKIVLDNKVEIDYGRIKWLYNEVI